MALIAVEDGKRLGDHPLLARLQRPNPHQSGSELLEAVYAYLQTAGNAYLTASVIDGEVKGIFGLRPDRMEAVVGSDGYASAYAYTAGGKTQTLRQDAVPVAGVLHMALFHPLDDHYGLSPLEAAQQSLDLHNAAARWNKALLDNSARPSGALVYSAGAGHLTDTQFSRLKDELEGAFQGAANAGRPMVLEGGLDRKSIGISPKDMDFIEAKHAAAREIALAFGVPPMLLGIPGDNTYSNFAEANKSLWRQTIVPLVRRVADDLGFWLAPGFGGRVKLEPDLDRVEALSEDQASRWTRIGGASFSAMTRSARCWGWAMDDLTRTIAERGDLAHLALFLWASGASGLLVWTLRETRGGEPALRGLRQGNRRAQPVVQPQGLISRAGFFRLCPNDPERARLANHSPFLLCPNDPERARLANRCLLKSQGLISCRPRLRPSRSSGNSPGVSQGNWLRRIRDHRVRPRAWRDGPPSRGGSADGGNPDRR